MYKQIKNLIIDLGGNHEDNASFSDSEIEARTNKLLNEFNNIFYKNGDCTQKNDFSIATFISKLNLKEY